MKITIIGAAGTLGSCTAFNILVHGLATELVLIDPWRSVLRGHWMDLDTAATGQEVAVTQGENEDMGNSDIVIITAGAPIKIVSSRKELLPANLKIIAENAQNINRYCPGAIVITATNPVDSLNYAMYLCSSDKDRRRYIGYSLNDSYRFRQITARVLGAETSRVQGTVIGEHDLSQVPLFSSLRLDGEAVKADAELKSKIRSQMTSVVREFENLEPKRTTGWTSAVGMASIVNAIKNDTGEVIPCNAVLAGEYGYRGVSMTVPAVIGKEGIVNIRELALAPDEIEGLEKSVQTIIPDMKYVEENLKTSLQ